MMPERDGQTEEGGRDGEREGGREARREKCEAFVGMGAKVVGGMRCMAACVLFPHAMCFDFEDARRPRPASPGSVEALAAGPAAKEVDEEKTENGVVDTCGGRGKKGHRGKCPEEDFFWKKTGPGKCVILSVGLLIFGRFSGPGKAAGGPPRSAVRKRPHDKPGPPGASKGHPSMQEASGQMSPRFLKNL